MVGAEKQALDGPPLVARSIGVEAVVVERGALDDRGNDGVIDVMGDLPAEGDGAQLAGASVGGGRRHAHPLGVELRARSQPDENEPALFIVGNGQAAGRGRCLTRAQHG